MRSDIIPGVMEGIAQTVTDTKDLQKFAMAYLDKYNWDVSKMDSPVFLVQPRVVFGQVERTFTQTATLDLPRAKTHFGSGSFWQVLFFQPLKHIDQKLSLRLAKFR